MLKLQTPVDAGKSKVEISLDDKILVIGSCFADNVGRKMLDLGLDVCVNPFGTLYNPLSIRSSLRRLRSGEKFVAEECRMMGSGAGLVCSFSHHTSFARKTEDEFLENANATLERASGFFAECGKVIITLGTSFCYLHIEDDVVVSNCLKRDAREFERKMLDFSDAADAFREILDLCKGKEVIFTVSPIRHLRDGAHGNQLSKAMLLLSADKVCREHEGCEYFPAYEIMMDELRDYRFYAEDMVHPSQQAVNYIWERFCDFAVKEKDRLKSLEKAYRQSLHIPHSR